MQTFLPDPDFARSAELLDSLRLGKQRVEALMVLRALRIPGYGWRHHPAARMWRGYDEALAAYGLAVCREWCRRGYADTCADKITIEIGGTKPRTQAQLRRAKRLPPWLGDEAFHRAHRSNLVRKDPAFYGPKFPDVPNDLEDIWPPGPPPA